MKLHDSEKFKYSEQTLAGEYVLKKNMGAVSSYMTALLEYFDSLDQQRHVYIMNSLYYELSFYFYQYWCSCEGFLFQLFGIKIYICIFHHVI